MATSAVALSAPRGIAAHLEKNARCGPTTVGANWGAKARPHQPVIATTGISTIAAKRRRDIEVCIPTFFGSG
jgi:hypothetical protein